MVMLARVCVLIKETSSNLPLQTQSTTAFRSRVSTTTYGASEVLGLDSYSSETSGYTVLVGCWSLG